MSFVSAAPLPTLLFSAVALLAVTGCNVSLDVSGDVTRRVDQVTIDPAGVRAVSVITDNGDIDVVAGTGDIVVDTAIAEHDEGDATSSIDVIGDTLVIDGTCDEGWFDRCEVGYRLAVPAGLQVTVETDNGDVHVVNLAGPVDLTTDNGDIDGSGLAGGVVRVTTENGDVDLAFGTAPEDVAAYSDNGSVVIELPRDGHVYAVDAVSDNGDVDVSVPDDPDARRTVSAKSDNGRVAVSYLAG